MAPPVPPPPPRRPSHPTYAAAATAFAAACKGIGCDEATLIKIVSSYNNAQLQEVAKEYQAQTGRLISDTIKKELHGDLEDLFLLLFKPHYEAAADIVYNACKGAGTDEKALLNIIFTSDGMDLANIAAIFQKKYTKTMEETIRKDVTGKSPWHRLMFSWIANKRAPRGRPGDDADALYKAAKGMGCDEDVFIRILGTSVPEEYREITRFYKEKYQKDLDDVIKKEFTGLNEQAFRAAHHFLLHPAEAVALFLHLSMKGAGTDEDRLSTMTALYYDRYPMTVMHYAVFGNLAKDIKGDTSRWYEKALLALWQLV